MPDPPAHLIFHPRKEPKLAMVKSTMPMFAPGQSATREAVIRRDSHQASEVSTSGPTHPPTHHGTT